MEMPTSSVQQSESETRVFFFSVKVTRPMCCFTGGGYPEQQPHTTETQVQSHNDAGGLPYPRHHRDNAISGVSQGQLNEIKAVDERRGHGGGIQQNSGGGTHPSWWVA